MNLEINKSLTHIWQHNPFNAISKVIKLVEQMTKEGNKC